MVAAVAVLEEVIEEEVMEEEVTGKKFPKKSISSNFY
jgi:hypothetical protein